MIDIYYHYWGGASRQIIVVLAPVEMKNFIGREVVLEAMVAAIGMDKVFPIYQVKCCQALDHEDLLPFYPSLLLAEEKLKQRQKGEKILTYFNSLANSQCRPVVGGIKLINRPFRLDFILGPKIVFTKDIQTL